MFFFLNEQFQLEYLDYNDRLVKESTSEELIVIDNLRPHRNYTFTVTTRSGNNGSELRVSLPMSASFSTKESVPEKVRFDFHFSSID